MAAGICLAGSLPSVTDGSIAGVDVSEAMVAYCRQHVQIAILTRDASIFAVRTAEMLPFQAAQFDKVCTVNSVFYWNDAPRAIAEIWRVLKVKWTLVICFTCKESLQAKNFARNGLALYDPDDVRVDDGIGRFLSDCYRTSRRSASRVLVYDGS